MKTILTAYLVIATLVGTPAYATPSCIPGHVQHAGAWWVSVIYLPGVLALGVLGRAGDLPNNGKHLDSLNCSTKAMVNHAAGHSRAKPAQNRK